MKSHTAASAFVVDLWGVGATRHVTLGIMVSCDIAKTDQW